MIRRPPRSTRTDTLFSLHDALPISGMNQVDFMSYLSNSFSRRRVPTSPANIPREMSSGRSEEHTSELQSLMRISYAVFCLNKNKHDVYIKKSNPFHPDN